MALVPWSRRDEWDPFRSILDLQKEINNLFGNSLSHSLEKKDAFEGGFWAPAVDIHDEKDKYLIKANLPGVKENEIDILVDDDTLTIKGERKYEKEQREKGCYRSERAYGTFQRSFVLPASIDANKINANYRNGVLEVSIPKTEETKKKQVKIEIEK
jgi:HSP20 family protein